MALSAEGLPGVGKTTLAVALAHHRHDFGPLHRRRAVGGPGHPAGPVGHPGRVGRRPGRGCDRPPHARRPGQRGPQRHRPAPPAPGDRRRLDPDAAKALRLGGPGCAHLLTTRDQAIARSFGTVQSVEVLDPAPARQLLAELAPITAQPNPDGPDLVAQLLAAVGYLPLAIQLMGGYLNGENGGEPVAFATQARTVLARLADPATRPGFRGRHPERHHRPQLGRSQPRPTPPPGATFHALGAFAPKPARFDLAVAQAVTQAEPATLARLIQRNLLEKGPDESLALHQTIADYARSFTLKQSTFFHAFYFLNQGDLINDRNASYFRE